MHGHLAEVSIASISIWGLPPPGSDAGGRPGKEPHAGSGDDAAGRKILIVEDEWFIAMESETVLRDAGFDVVGVATSADQAVALAERERPELVLMDIRLRGSTDGIDAAIAIRERLGIQCVFASAHSESWLRARSGPAEPLGWLTKPFSERQLLQAVHTALASLSAEE